MIPYPPPPSEHDPAYKSTILDEQLTLHSTKDGNVKRIHILATALS
jgi:hypothetical protein